MPAPKVKTHRYRVEAGGVVQLERIPTRDSLAEFDRKALRKALAKQLGRIVHLQEKLFVSNSGSLLLVFQGMDAAGKDGVIRAVTHGVNPQGFSIASFKEPTEDELAHSWLHRHWTALPPRGQIALFNRSHYEEVLVVRVHPEYLASRRLPWRAIDDSFWGERLEDIRGFERHLVRNGTRVVKFFLHVSPEEQRRRFIRRLDDPAKNWKFKLSDTQERMFWDDYRAAYQDAIAATCTDDAPWFVVPADSKPAMRLIVAAVIAETLRSMSPRLPATSDEEQKTIDEYRQTLTGASQPEPTHEHADGAA